MAILTFNFVLKDLRKKYKFIEFECTDLLTIAEYSAQPAVTQLK